MRWIYLTVVVLFVAATVIFVFQNVAVVTMSFLGLLAFARRSLFWPRSHIYLAQ